MVGAEAIASCGAKESLTAVAGMGCFQQQYIIAAIIGRDPESEAATGGELRASPGDA
jgi:hypothetical protein